MSGCLDQLTDYLKCASTVGPLEECIQDEVRAARMGAADPGASSSSCTAFDATCPKAVLVAEAGRD